MKPEMYKAPFIHCRFIRAFPLSNSWVDTEKPNQWTERCYKATQSWGHTRFIYQQTSTLRINCRHVSCLCLKIIPETFHMTQSHLVCCFLSKCWLWYCCHVQTVTRHTFSHLSKLYTRNSVYLHIWSNIKLPLPHELRSWGSLPCCHFDFIVSEMF